MPDIVTSAETVERRIKTRARVVSIANPYQQEKRIEFVSEKITLVNNEMIGVKDAPRVVRDLGSVVTKVLTIQDPVTGQSVRISVAGLAMAIETAFVDWFLEDEAARGSSV